MKMAESFQAMERELLDVRQRARCAMTQKLLHLLAAEVSPILTVNMPDIVFGSCVWLL